MSIVVFWVWVVTPCAVFYMVIKVSEDSHPEDGLDTFLRHIGNHLQDYTASQRRRPQSTIALVHFTAQEIRAAFIFSVYTVIRKC
jgi:hypothetical protein